MNVLGHKWVYFFCVFCVFNASCNRKTPVTAGGDTQNETRYNQADKTIKSDTGAYVLLQLERTGCYGNCPVYAVLLRSNGTAQFSGSKNVDLIGTYIAVAGKTEVTAIMDKLKQIDFFKFADHYPQNKNYIIPDLPYTYITANDGNKTKKVADNYDSPENLQWFEKELDEFFKQLKWTKIKD